MVRLGDKTNGQFGFLCMKGIVCPGLYFLSTCSCVFCLVSAQDYLFAILNVTFFRGLGFHWACVCSAPSKVQFSVYCHCRFSVCNVEVVTGTVLLLCLRNMKTCSNKQVVKNVINCHLKTSNELCEEEQLSDRNLQLLYINLLFLVTFI